MSFAAVEALAQVLGGVVVHQEADRAAMHAVDRLAGFHELVQGLQHQAVAAERDDDVGFLRLGIAVAPPSAAIGVARFRRLAGDDCDGLKAAH